MLISKVFRKNNLFNRKMGNFAAQFNCISFLKISILYLVKQWVVWEDGSLQNIVFSRFEH
ncbi:hypothetical protein DW916_13375 [Segatella copri]|uniref:Uncharacterized protein n=1 Tax=Segatella copri TaxID=165179 RepID=A0AA92UXK1_9BACT|nr:hypothetical protein DW916_13375 [Segatella copri]